MPSSGSHIFSSLLWDCKILHPLTDMDTGLLCWVEPLKEGWAETLMPCTLCFGWRIVKFTLVWASKMILGQYICAHKHCTNYNNHSWLARCNDWSKWFYLREGLWSFILPISMFMGWTWERISKSSRIWEILLKTQNTGYGWSCSKTLFYF
jgi:hypothetical protein